MNFFKFLFSKAFWVQVLLAIIVTVILVFLALKWLELETHHDESVPVPDLTGLRLEKVDKKLTELQLNYVVTDSARYNPEYPPYTVIDQNPMAGHHVKEGRDIYLKLNPSGYPEIKMPNLIRHTKRQVIPVLRSLGFEIGDITYKPDIARDVVLEMHANGEIIHPGDKIRKATTINLVLGSGNRTPQPAPASQPENAASNKTGNSSETE